MADTATMSDADTSHAHPAEPHAADPHGTHGGSHGHGTVEDEPLGPVDLAAWAYAVAGAALGLLLVIALYLAST
jgi:hypothetical protein